jgi:hypothetical protein
MKQVGEFIQQAIEASEIGANDEAFAAACAALEVTLKKTLETDDLSNADYQKFIRKYWQLLSFMGLPRALPLPLDVDVKLNRIVNGFNLHGAEELILHLVRQTAVMGRTPAQFKFHKATTIEIHGQQILVPLSLIGGLVGIVICQPVNKNETVPDKHWMNVSDFKMFISEFWGRIDLAERIMNLYLN